MKAALHYDGPITGATINVNGAVGDITAVSGIGITGTISGSFANITTERGDISGSFNANGATALTSLTYAYNNANIRTQVNDGVGRTVTNYIYDQTYQLTSEQSTASLAWATLTADQWAALTADQWATLPVNALFYSTSVTYDNNGNPLVDVRADGTVTCTFNGANRMPTRETNSGTTTYTYDGAGNRTSKIEPGGMGTTTYTWDGDGRLSSVQRPAAVGGGTFTFTYHADGMLTSKETASATTRFVWNGGVLQALADGSGGVTKVFNQGQGQRAGQYGDLVNTRDVAGGTDSFILPDAQGTAAATANDSGAKTGGIHLDAFGNAVTSTGTPDATLAYIAQHGYLFDPDIGLYYVRDRWYDPLTRRWISEDRLGFAAGDYNLYRYVGNSPATRDDPSGRQGSPPVASNG